MGGERSLTLCGFFVVFGLWRKRIDLRLSQMKCYSGSVYSCKVYGSCRGIYGRPPRNLWELSFWSRSNTACIVNFVTHQSAQSQLGQFRCRLMCLVYIRCLFCEASGTSSIGCFVCDLHRFSIKLKWECETLENWVRVLQVHYENGLCTPPS